MIRVGLRKTKLLVQLTTSLNTDYTWSIESLVLTRKENILRLWRGKSLGVCVLPSGVKIILLVILTKH